VRDYATEARDAMLAGVAKANQRERAPAAAVSAFDEGREHGPETWIADLEAAGWTAVRHDTWVSPDGRMFRGPYGAWCAMLTERLP